jgi:adenylate kinase family enzyme
MRKILMFGNSGSGKSILARKLCAGTGLAHLDLDTLAWQPTSPPERKPLNESQIEIENFIDLNDGWVIEGCYTDLLEMAVAESNEMIFMNLPINACLANTRNRPWEPHKYESKQAQDANLEMLLSWVSQYSERTDTYSERTDTFSESAHYDLFVKYPGKKTMFTSNNQNT